MKLIIVESPHKAKVIQGFMGKEYKVMSSVGHIRDLPEKAKGDDIGVDLQTFEGRYEVPKSKGQTAAQLKQAAKNAEVIYLCSDADREGEAIAWHLTQLLGRKNFKRAKYTEITKKAVTTAIANAGSIDMPLVEAQQARRFMDRIIGYQASPIMSKALGGGNGTGRVQAAALAIICARQREIAAFKPQTYWTIGCQYPEGFRANFKADGEKKGEGEDESHGDEKESTGSRIFQEALADAVAKAATTLPHTVESIEKKEAESKPKPPFTTSVMQQIVSNALGCSTEDVMKAAQRLYEAGMISYHRTDSTAVDKDFQAEALKFLAELERKEGVKLVPGSPRVYKQKAAAQGAHECIRPVSLAKTPSGSEFDDRVYSLVYYHFLASQAASAKDFVTTVTTKAGDYKFEAVGRKEIEAGYRALLSKASGRTKKDAEMPALTQGQRLQQPTVDKKKAETKPKPLLKEADWVRIMEKEEVGRPSTYSSTLNSLLHRNYVERTKDKRLKATPSGEQALVFMERKLPELPNVAYTAEIERQLDEIAEGKDTRRKVMSDWYSIWTKTVSKAKATSPVLQQAE